MHRHAGVEHGAYHCRRRQRSHDAGGEGGPADKFCATGDASHEPRRPVAHRTEVPGGAGQAAATEPAEELLSPVSDEQHPDDDP
jgi:hypothetical protein